MLKNIDPLLGPDLLKVLCEMGHGDEIVLTDANFTAASLGRHGVVLRLRVTATAPLTTGLARAGLRVTSVLLGYHLLNRG